MNPYDWQSHNPQVEIPRDAEAQVVKTLGRGGSAAVLGGRGMGKSVFLHQVRAALEREDGVRVVVVPAPPPELTVRGCLDQLSDYLGVPGGALSTRKIIDVYFSGTDAPQRLVLLFDEFDRYAERVDLLMGWHVEREALNAAGRTDLKLRRNGDPRILVVEVKIWGRNDYREAQEQIESYWSAEVATGAVVQVTDADVRDWPESYRRLLETRVRSVETQTVPPVRARLDCVSETADGLAVHVDHFLLRLSRRT